MDIFIFELIAHCKPTHNIIGCTRHLFRKADTLNGLRPVRSVAVNGIIGKKYVEQLGIHQAIGKTFVASWAHASLISVPQLMNNGCWVLGVGESMHVRDKRGRVVVQGKRMRSGLFMARDEDLFHYDEDDAHLG